MVFLLWEMVLAAGKLFLIETLTASKDLQSSSIEKWIVAIDFSLAETCKNNFLVGGNWQGIQVSKRS